MTQIKSNNTNMFSYSFIAWTICFIGMAFYCYNYFLRSSLSIMQTNIMDTFHLSATQWGLFGTFYYLAYTPMQIPAGMLYDKFGARFVFFGACITAVMGVSLFVAANNLTLACAGRFLIGLGTAFAYIGVLKLASIWLPPNRFAVAAGLTTAVGMSSSALTQKYLSKVVEVVGYQHILHITVIVGIALSAVILLLMKSRPKQKKIGDTLQPVMTMAQLFSALRINFTNPQMWIIGIIGCLLYLPSIVFVELFGINYFKVAHQLTAQQAGSITALVSLGWIIGGPIIGIISDRIKRRRLPLLITSAITAVLLYTIFYFPSLTLDDLYAIALIVGFCCGAHPLCFALSKENNPIPIAGTAVAVTNMFIMMGGVIFPSIVGKLLDLHASNILAPDGLRIYNASDYTFALSIIPLGIVISTLLSLFIKETYCESKAVEVDERTFAAPSSLTPEVQAAN